MFCFHCGEKIPDNSKACNFCGTSFVGGGRTSLVPPPPKNIPEKSSADEALAEFPHTPQLQTPEALASLEKNPRNLFSAGAGPSLPGNQHQIQFPTGTILGSHSGMGEPPRL